MKPEINILDISKKENQEVTVAGWVFNKRSSGKIHFLLVRDGTGILQCTAGKNDVGEAIFDLMDKIPQESSVMAKGKVRKDQRAPGGYELLLKELTVINRAQEYPITPKEHGIDFLLDKRHLWLRSLRQNAILRIRHEIINAMRDYFNQNGFILLDSPIFTPNVVEGTSTLFETEYFDTKAYLTQSGQLYAEAGAMAFGKVYCFGPTFRAEKSKTRRHLTEFWMVEPEMAFYDIYDNMDLMEDFLCFVVHRVLESRHEELKTLERNTQKLELIQKPFPRIHYDEACKILKDGGIAFEYGNDFGAPDETFISAKFDRPLMVHHYPAAVKAFYMKRDPKEPDKVLSCDVLAPEGYGEIIGGSQREDDYKTLVSRIKEHQLPLLPFEWYLDLRRYGSVPHSGFGLGVERTVAWICGLEHIRETIPFPRTIYRLNP